MKERIICLFTGIFWSIKTRFRIMSLNIHRTAKIANTATIKRGSVLHAGSYIGNHSQLYRRVVIGKDVKVGEYTSINNSTVIECGNIGNGCSFGIDCIIGPGRHAMNFFSTSSLLYNKFELFNKSFSEPPVIENDVWIGSRSIVMQGVTVHNGAVIGANSVVTKDVPPYAIVAGVPARIIRYRFDEAVREKMEKKRAWGGQINKLFIDKMLSYGDEFIYHLEEE